MNNLLYRLQNLGKAYQGPAEELTILNNINLEIVHGQSVAIVGASGSGKSTLLHIMGTLDQPSTGKIFFENQNLHDLDENARAQKRNRDIGFVFQFHHLLPEFNTLENVAMPGIVAGHSKTELHAKAQHMLELVGLGDRLQHKVTTLSGGERQRASIARALLLAPKVVLADEPTGNLDEKTAATVISLLLDLNQRLHTTIIVVTHNITLANQMDRQLVLRSGELYEH